MSLACPIAWKVVWILMVENMCCMGGSKKPTAWELSDACTVIMFCLSSTLIFRELIDHWTNKLFYHSLSQDCISHQLDSCLAKLCSSGAGPWAIEFCTKNTFSLQPKQRENYRTWPTEIHLHLRVSFTVAAVYLRTYKLARLPSKKRNYVIRHAYLKSIYCFTAPPHLGPDI